MVGCHHRLNGHEFEQALGDSEEQGSLACCSPWGPKESDMNERLNNNKLHLLYIQARYFSLPFIIHQSDNLISSSMLLYLSIDSKPCGKKLKSLVSQIYIHTYICVCIYTMDVVFVVVCLCTQGCGLNLFYYFFVIEISSIQFTIPPFGFIIDTENSKLQSFQS